LLCVGERHIYTFGSRQNMRMAKHGQCVERKTTSALSSKLIDVISDRILPLAQEIDSLQPLTRFAFTQDEALDAMLLEVHRDNPTILQSRELFHSTIMCAYDQIILPKT
jgi:hypothetical protein